MAFLDLRLRNSLSTTYLILFVILIHHFANIGRRFQIFRIQEENVFIQEIWTPELQKERPAVTYEIPTLWIKAPPSKY